MEVLIVCSGNVPNFNFKIHRAFIYEQIESVKKRYGVEYDTFFIRGKGVKGYLSNFNSLIKKINKNNYNLVHAHNMPSGLFSRLQLKLPLVVTFHGSDINVKLYRMISNILSKFTSHNILVSKQQYSKLLFPTKTTVVPCGIDLEIFSPLFQNEAKEKLNLDSSKTYILFSSAFDKKIKNYSLAKAALKYVPDSEIEIVELKNKSRIDVNLLLNACDMLLLTSFSEGSPQIIKEAMACNCPIVASDTGDIKEVIGNTEGCYITSFVPKDVAEKIKKALDFGKRTDGREKIKHLDVKIIAQKIIGVYKKVLESGISS